MADAKKDDAVKSVQVEALVRKCPFYSRANVPHPCEPQQPAIVYGVYEPVYRVYPKGRYGD